METTDVSNIKASSQIVYPLFVDIEAHIAVDFFSQTVLMLSLIEIGSKTENFI